MVKKTAKKIFWYFACFLCGVAAGLCAGVFYLEYEARSLSESWVNARIEIRAQEMREEFESKLRQMELQTEALSRALDVERSRVRAYESALEKIFGGKTGAN